MDTSSTITFHKLPTNHGIIKLHIFFIHFCRENKTFISSFYTYTLPKASSFLLTHPSHHWLVLRDQMDVELHFAKRSLSSNNSMCTFWIFDMAWFSSFGFDFTNSCNIISSSDSVFVISCIHLMKDDLALLLILEQWRMEIAL